MNPYQFDAFECFLRLTSRENFALQVKLNMFHVKHRIHINAVAIFKVSKRQNGCSTWNILLSPDNLPSST